MAKHPPETLDAVRQLWEETDLSASEIGRRLGLNKNVVIGMARRCYWFRNAPRPTTLAERMDALHADLDRVLAETRGVGRIKCS